MSTVPRLTNRYDRLVEMAVHDRADVRAYRFGAANSLDTAFAGVTAMFTVASGATFRSRSVQRRGLGLSVYENRNLTHVCYDPEDFWAGGGTLPHDAEGAYVRVAEQDAGGTFRPAGPILIVPPPGFFSTTRPNLSVSGTAPNVAATATLTPPDGAMHFVLPRFADSVTVMNRDAASLFVSFNRGLPEVEIPTGETVLLPDAAVSEVFVRGDGATVAFNMYFAIVNAEMA